jgi:hypothetical protein
LYSDLCKTLYQLKKEHIATAEAMRRLKISSAILKIGHEGKKTGQQHTSYECYDNGIISIMKGTIPGGRTQSILGPSLLDSVARRARPENLPDSCKIIDDYTGTTVIMTM